MSILASMGRVMASQDILGTIDESIANGCGSTLELMISADLHWRREDWRTAISMASRVLEQRPNDFHALAVIATCYGHLEEIDAARPYAKRLMLAKSPSWRTVKAAFTLFRIPKLVTTQGRAGHRRIMERCDREIQADKDALLWAQELVSTEIVNYSDRKQHVIRPRC